MPAAFEHGAGLFTADVWAIWQDCIDAARERFAGWPEPVDFEIVRHGGERVGAQHLPPSLWAFVKDVARTDGGGHLGRGAVRPGRLFLGDP